MRPASLLAVYIFFCLGCGDDSVRDAGPDSGVDAPDASDAASDTPPDVGVDSGPPPPGLCAVCRRDEDCAPGALCLVLADGERGCGVPCSEDADCQGLGWDAECAEEVAGLGLQCRPTSDSCVTVAVGTPCASEADCGGRYDRCVDADGLGGVCTARCSVDADCPIGAHRCRAVEAGTMVCVGDELPAAERCQRLVDRGGAAACTLDADCATGVCLAPPEGPGVCAVPAPCPAGVEIAPGLCAPSAPSDGPAAEIVADCGCYAAAVEGSLFDEAIAELGRDRCDLRWPSAVMNLIDPRIVHDPFRLSFTDRILGDWSSAVPFAQRVGADLDDASVADAIARAAAWIDLGATSTSPASGDDLVDALAALLEATGATPDRSSIETQVGALSTTLARRLAPIVGALRDAVVARDAAVSRFAGDLERYYDGPSGLFIGGGLTGLDLRRSDERGALLGDVDVAAMAAAAARLAATIEAADLGTLDPAAGELTLETPVGRIAVRGPEDHVYDEAEWGRTLLLVDLGGDDTYRGSAGATSGPDHGVSILIDVAGADAYGYDEVPDPGDAGPTGHARLPSDREGRLASPPASTSTVSRQGVGRLGIGMLFDLGAASDSYRSLRLSQGLGVLGVGVLFDEGGDDEYHAEAVCQGAGAFGIGLLVDRAGNDRYTAYHMAQGFAYARGFGALHDTAGDDVYLLHPSDVLYPSAQDPMGSNSSLGQGAGFGRRADFVPDRVFMSGGLGVLRDVSGADRYTAAIFGQASGFWYGTGILSDGSGDDRYDGQWYVQSGSAHFALSVLLEGDGNDVYNETARRQNVTHGGGHDFSLAVFVDRAGDDTYAAPGLSFGAGNAAGTGIFGDAGGTDSYDATRNLSIGNASIAMLGDSLREMAKTVGIFVEADGVDTYARPDPMPVANDATWRQTAHPGEPSEEGVGIDRASANLGF